MTKNYYLKRPSKDRHTFAIYSQVILPDGITKNETIDNKDVHAINKQLLAGSINMEHAERLVQAIKNKIAGTQPEIYNNDNDKLLVTFMKQYFNDKPFLVSNDSAANKYARAVRALGKHSVMTVTRNEALAAVMSLTTNNQRREAAHKLNSMFKKLGRPVVVPVEPKEHDEVTHVSESDMLKLVAAADTPELAIFIKLAFYCGARIQEIAAFTPSSKIEERVINVATQIDRYEGRKSAPKNRKKRKAYLDKAGIKAFNDWVSLPAKPDYYALYRQFTRLVYNVLKRTDLSPHSLRHSYAIYMLSSGVPIQLVAQSMGNSVKVCEDSYAGFVLSDQGIDTISRILG